MKDKITTSNDSTITFIRPEISGPLISAADMKAVSDISGASGLDCRVALQKSDGDVQKAIDYLREIDHPVRWVAKVRK